MTPCVDLLRTDDGLRIDVGVELDGASEASATAGANRAFTEEGEVVRSATPAGIVASTTHLGPYGGLGAAHEAIHLWCKANNHRFAGPSWEIYGHWEPEWERDPSRIRTDIYYLLMDPA